MLSLLQKSLLSNMMMTLKPKFHWTTDGGKFIWIFMSLNLNSSRENSELLTHPCGPCPDCLYQWRWWYRPALGQSGGQLLNFIFLFEHQPFIIETGGGEVWVVMAVILVYLHFYTTVLPLVGLGTTIQTKYI